MAPRSHLRAAGLSLALLAACGDPAPPRSTQAPQPAQPPAARSRSAGPACKNPGAGPEPDAQGIRGLVRRNLGGIRNCYDSALKRNPSLAGKAILRFSIGPCGQVSDVDVASRGGSVAEAGDCVERLARAWRTPFRPAEPVAVEYPLTFSAQ
jgi:outer membrane biosynthesis protein TonB